MSAPRFQLGQVVSTPNALESVSAEDIAIALDRHMRGDWRDLDEEDSLENERSLVEGFRLLSSYLDRNRTKFWIITEADRSVTTVLLPSDY